MELKIEGLSKTYNGDKKALENLNVTLGRGVHGILGPNGAGKSTLMKILTNNLKPDQGNVLYGGETIFECNEAYCAALGYMPQIQSMYSSFTVAEFLNYMACLKNMPKKEIKPSIKAVLEAVQLSDMANKRIGTLSGGMKQRVLLAQAVLSNPRILILDEPTAGLDPYQRILIRNLISKLSTDCIVLLATHIVQDIELISTDILLMDKGILIDYDTPENLKKKIYGHVYEVIIPDGQIPNNWLISSIRQKMDGNIVVRLLSSSSPEGYNYTIVEPNLEDVFLYRTSAAEESFYQPGYDF